MASVIPFKLLGSVQPSERFAVRVRVIAFQPSQSSDNEGTQKSPKITRFGFHGRDQKGTVARFVGYGKEVCLKFEPLIQMDGVYTVERAALKSVEPRFRLNGFPYDIQLSVFSKVTRVEDDSRIAHVDVSLINKIDQIADIEDGDQLNFVGYIVTVSDVMDSDVTSQASVKRHLVFGDAYGDKITLTLWNNMARVCQVKEGDVVVAYRVKKSSYDGCSVVATTVSELKVEPINIPEVAALKKWLQQKDKADKKRKADVIADEVEGCTRSKK